MLRPGRVETSTLVPDVEGSSRVGNLVLRMWFAAPSSCGTGRSAGRDGPLEAVCW